MGRCPRVEGTTPEMMQGPAVFTPATLADRWACSERHVRLMVERGILPAFRLGGKLIRIRREDVEAFECNHGVSPNCEASSPLHGQMKTGFADAIASEHRTGKRRRAAPRLDTPR
ncbi:helix-turn-helix domain-containing protein [Chelativorans petroleitrophicus]|uniref:helix-turn-helix domain-containing protein n=1 Tax=Chelativorans petroleitrophicus TaxID=2975484 RepID=UPI003C306AAC